jgi:glutathione S-transferase
MIRLYQFARVWGTPNLSPFCCKVETYLRIAEIPYEVVSTSPLSAPKRKLPYIDDDGTTLCDSRFIIECLADRYRDLDAGLTPAERAQSIAFQRMIEDDLFWAMIHTRFVQPHNWEANKAAILSIVPRPLRGVFGMYARRSMCGQLWGQGLGRHSDEEIIQVGQRELTALSDFLAKKPYFLGDEPTTLDCSAFGLINNVVWPPIESALKEHASGLHNLVAFCERIHDAYYSELVTTSPSP